MNIDPEVVACMNDMLDIVVKKGQRRLYRKQYRQKNKEKIHQQNKEYYQKNKEQIAHKRHVYNQTPEGIKNWRICKWREKGIICDNFDAMYDHYLKTSYCDFCRVELTYDKTTTATTKCLDHDHSITDRPNFRNILCNLCNIKRR